jgi:PhnB protein
MAEPVQTVTPHLVVSDAHAAIEFYKQAVRRAADAGATVTLAPWDASWGSRYARIVDPFGHSWSFSHPLPEKA